MPAKPAAKTNRRSGRSSSTAASDRSRLLLFGNHYIKVRRRIRMAPLLTVDTWLGSLVRRGAPRQNRRVRGCQRVPERYRGGLLLGVIVSARSVKAPFGCSFGSASRKIRPVRFKPLVLWRVDNQDERIGPCATFVDASQISKTAAAGSWRGSRANGAGAEV